MNSASLLGRHAVITGGSQGLGLEIARSFLGAGADIAICARTESDINLAANGLRGEFPNRVIVGAACDIASPGQIDRFYDLTLNALGHIDVVVNNAGIHGGIGSIDEVDWQAWQRAILVNLLGTVFSCRRAVQHFKSRGSSHGRRKIINLSGGGATAPQPGLSAYGASKAGLVRFTETLALEVQPFAIDVNAVAPGALRTRLLNELKAVGPEKIGAENHARVEAIHAKGGMSMGFAAQLCVYLASEASDGVTGRLISAAWDPWPFSKEIVADLEASDIYTLRRIIPKDRARDWDEKP